MFAGSAQTACAVAVQLLLALILFCGKPWQKALHFNLSQTTVRWDPTAAVTAKIASAPAVIGTMTSILTSAPALTGAGYL